MKTLTVDFRTRVRLGDIVGGATGMLMKTSALEPVLLELQFTEAERARLTIVQLPDGREASSTETPEEFAKTITMEDTQAAWVLRELNETTRSIVGDSVWVAEVRRQLEAGPPMPSTQVKSKRRKE